MKRIKSFEGTNPFYFVASPIGNLSEFSPRAIELLKSVDFICVEDTRVSLKLLSHFGISKRLIPVHKFSEQQKINEILTALEKGEKGAFLSDAGYPLLSDPGDILLRNLLANNYPLSVINGPSAFLPALVLSNLPVTPFSFLGFLPSKDGERKKVLETYASHSGTLVFYEAPHRVNKIITSLYEVFGNRKLVIARELTKIHEEYIYTTLQTYTANPLTLKGEIVLVVQGKEENKEKDLDVYLTYIERLVNENYKSSEAIKIVALLFNINKNDLYNYYLEKKNS